MQSKVAMYVLNSNYHTVQYKHLKYHLSKPYKKRKNVSIHKEFYSLDTNEQDNTPTREKVCQSP